MKKTYKELGENSTYTYPKEDIGNIKKVTVSNSISSLNFVKGKDNNIAKMLMKVENVGSYVKTIEASSFVGCDNLKSFETKNPLWSIGNDAFHDCSSLVSLKLDKINGIGNNAFNGTNIQNLTLDLRCASEDTSAGYDYEGCEYTSLEVGPHIGDYCFANNKNLKTVELCTSTQLGQYMFQNCTNLTSVSFANHGQCVGRNAFENCTSLSSITFPKNFEMYSQQMFKGCTNLTSVYTPHDATKFTTIEASAFQDCPSITAVSIPQSINSMEAMDDNAFKGSSVTHLWFRGISSDTMSEYCQVIKVGSGFKPIEAYEDFRYGIWYGFNKDRTDEMKDKEQRLQKKIVAYAKKNYIPLFLIFCATDCSYCRELKQYVLNQKTFQEWMINQPYLFCYCTQNTSYTWDLLQECGFKLATWNYIKQKWNDDGETRIGIPAYMKIWYKEDGQTYKTYKSRGLYPYSSKEDKATAYTKKVISYIPQGFEGYQKKAEFDNPNKTIEEKNFPFWGIQNRCKLKPADSDNYKYEYDENGKCLKKIENS